MLGVADRQQSFFDAAWRSDLLPEGLIYVLLAEHGDRIVRDRRCLRSLAPSRRSASPVGGSGRTEAPRRAPRRLEAKRLHRALVGETLGEREHLGEQARGIDGRPWRSEEHPAKSSSRTIRSPCSASGT